MANNLIVCGGTFDHFHKGHISLLKLAFSLGKKVLIGITSDVFVEKSKIKNQISKIESFAERKKSVLEFIKKQKTSDKAEIIKINDLFGPTLSRDLLIDGIVVSEDTKKGADIINRKRKSLGLSPLKIFVAPSVMAEDGKLVSSARVRAGAINKEGRSYVKPAWFRRGLVLPENLRKEFKEPFGELRQEIDLKNMQNSHCIATVGDETSKKFNQNSVKQNISVVDFKIARKEKFSSFSELGFEGNEEVITVSNPPGQITSDLFSAISKIFESDFKNRIILKVIGEEDLSVLPLILLAPLDTIIYYGQPPLRPARRDFEGQAGIVKIIVSEQVKDKAYNLILKLKQV